MSELGAREDAKALVQGRLFAIPDGAIDGMDEPVGEVVEAQEVAAEEPPKPVESKEDKEFVNPHAYIRRLERDKSILEDRMTELVGLVKTLSDRQVSEGKENAKEAEKEGEAPDPAMDPLGALFFEIKQLKTQIATKDQKTETRNEEKVIRAALADADKMVQEVAKQNPELYAEGLLHLSNILLENIREDNPKMTEKEILAVADNNIQAQKLKWIAEGHNPGVEFMKMARRYGYRPKFVEEPKAKPAAPKDGAKEEVRKGKETESKTRTLTNRDSGSPPSTGRDILKMDVNQFQRYMREQQEKGNLSNKGGTPPIHEILPGRGER